MVDKIVASCDFKGIRPNSLVKDIKTNKVGLCLETLITHSSLGEGASESYHSSAVVLIRGKREIYPTQDLVLVDDNQEG